MTPTPSSPAIQLADEFVRHRRATDHLWALWTGDVEALGGWDDLTPEGRERLLAELAEFEARASTTEPLDESDRVLLDTVGYTATAWAAQLEWREELGWVNHATGVLPSIFTFLPRLPLVTAEHGARHLRTVEELVPFLEGWSDRLAVAAAQRRAPIRHLVESTIAMLDRHLARPLSEGPLGAQAPPLDLDAPAAAAWRVRLHATLDGSVTGALARLRSVLSTDVLGAARPDDRPGLVHLPGGADVYERLVRAHTTLDVSASDVHEVGLRQVERLEREYVAVAGPVLGTDDVAEIYRRLRDDPSLRYTDAASIVADATTALAKAGAAADQWFATLPQAPCVASSIEQGALAFYSPPAPDGSKPGTFFFNTADPTMWATFQLEAVTYHESIPGHHLQMAIAQELEGLHPLLGRYHVTAYGEGWGLYSERLADEMGLYTGPMDRIGMLSADSMRACRLVVDTGMHALGWSRDEAIAYMTAHSPLSAVQVAGEIDRYIGAPGQALSYMIGRLEIDGLRSDAEARLGERFDVRAFHDVLLRSGSIPLPSLRRLVEAWEPGGAAS